MNSNRVAASLAPQDTDGCLRELDRLAPRIGLAEVRLDLMRTFDIGKLVANSPVPLILTCRPEREGGGFTGLESERAGILRTAWESGCAYIDVEADSLDLVTPATRVYVHVTRPDDALPAQQKATPGAELHVPLRAEDPAALSARLRKTLSFTIA